MHPNATKRFVSALLLLLPLATTGCPSIAQQRHARQQVAASTLDDYRGTWDGIAQSGALVRLVIDDDPYLVLPDGRISRLTVRGQEGNSFICAGEPVGGRGAALPRVVLYPLPPPYPPQIRLRIESGPTGPVIADLTKPHPFGTGYGSIADERWMFYRYVDWRGPTAGSSRGPDTAAEAKARLRRTVERLRESGWTAIDGRRLTVRHGEPANWTHGVNWGGFKVFLIYCEDGRSDLAFRVGMRAGAMTLRSVGLLLDYPAFALKTIPSTGRDLRPTITVQYYSDDPAIALRGPRDGAETKVTIVQFSNFQGDRGPGFRFDWE